MSVFDLPRLHFSGIATTQLPTGARSGLVDLATNTALTEDGPFPTHLPVQEYHDYLEAHGPRFNAAGRVTEGGAFNALKGWNFGGNGHFWIDAKIISVEVSGGDVEVGDPVVGRNVDMWGHYNEYLATTVNRARVFDVDPSSNWTTTLMVGQFCFGREGRSHDVGYMLIGDVHGLHPPRWHDFHHVMDVGDHPLAPQLRRSTLYQFVVRKDEGLTWLDEASVSPAVIRLRAMADSDGVDGLVVQLALGNMSTPLAPEGPNHWDLRGTIAPWRAHELCTYPAGRLLTPRRPRHDSSGLENRCGLHNLTVEVTPDHVTLNMINAVPATCRAENCGPGPTHQLGPLLDVGDLQLRTVDTDQLVAEVPHQAYLGKDCVMTSGIVTIPREAPGQVAGEQALCLVGTDADGNRVVLLSEQETTLQVDDACLILDHPKDGNDSGHDVEVLVRSFVRGRPRAIEAVTVRQFFNPKALPLDEVARSAQARCGDIEIVRLRAGGLDDPGDWSPTCTVRTDEEGRGAFTIRGARAGSARILLLAHADHPPCEVTQPGSAALGYDDDDSLGYWAGAGALSVRVLPDDWWLEDIPPEEVTFDLVYREVFAFYELLSSFMKAEVFSLADQFRVKTYARLIWQMCDPRNKTKTYYMPPTRDLSEPKAHLLLKFLRAQNTVSGVPTIVPAARRAHRGITTRGELLPALRHAAMIELAVMLQYLYAAFSIPTYGAGVEYVRRGEWTVEQLRLACGDGGATREEGMRSSLLTVAREEMIHFLVVNNIIMAIGEPFHIPSIDFGTINNQLLVPLDFSLEPLGVGSVARFIAIEQPEDLIGEVRRADIMSSGSREGNHPYRSPSELYANIREGLQRVPNLFLVDKGRGGGEHHLFLRESINAVHPDYQLEVDDLASALFAIDVITEQGEGNVLTSVTPKEESHFDTFLRMSELLMAEQMKGVRGRCAPWSPAYPLVRNPTLNTGNPAKELVTDPQAREILRLFNRSYFMMFQLMIQHFGQCPDASLRRSELMNMAIEVMTGVMRPLAEVLVRVPSGRRGKTAGPSFELESLPGYLSRPDVAWRAITLRFHHLAAATRQCSLAPTHVAETLEFLAERFQSPIGRGGTK